MWWFCGALRNRSQSIWESWVFPGGAHRYRCMQARCPSQDVGRALRRGARGGGCYAMLCYAGLLAMIVCRARAHGAGVWLSADGEGDGNNRVQDRTGQDKTRQDENDQKYVTRLEGARGRSTNNGTRTRQADCVSCLGIWLVSAHEARKSTISSPSLVGCGASNSNSRDRRRLGPIGANINCRSRR